MEGPSRKDASMFACGATQAWRHRLTEDVGGKHVLAVDRVNTANGAVNKKRSGILWTGKRHWTDPAPFALWPPHSFPQNSLAMWRRRGFRERFVRGFLSCCRVTGWCSVRSAVAEEDRWERRGLRETSHLKLELQRQKSEQTVWVNC